MHPTDYLQPLVAPLRFLAQSDFARVGTVKGLGPLVEAALVGARREGAATDVRLLERAAGALQTADLESARMALRALARRVTAPVVADPTPAPPTPGRAPMAGAPPPSVPVAGRPSGRAPRRGRPEHRPTRAELSRACAREQVGAWRPIRAEATHAGDAERPPRPRPAALHLAPLGPPGTAPRRIGHPRPPRLVEVLQRKGLHRVGDLLFLLPRVYEDRRRLRTLRELRPGERGVTVGTVRMARDLMIRPGKRGFQAVLADETGSIALTWFQTGPWMKGRVPVGKRLIVSGELRATPNGREMVHPELEPAEPTRGPSLHVGRIVPVYPGFERHEQRQVRELVARAAADTSAPSRIRCPARRNDWACSG